MKRTELKTIIRSVDIVKVWSKPLNTYIQVNKSKLLEVLDQLPPDSTWLNTYFRMSDSNGDGKSTLLIH